jgi:hypothetical protein
VFSWAEPSAIDRTFRGEESARNEVEAPMYKLAATVIFGLMAIAGAAILLIAGAGTGSAQGGNATFKLTNKAETAIMIKFFSKKRAHVWPSATSHENLNDDAQHTFLLACEAGEEICYGGSNTASNKKYWGVGLKGDKACKDCCITCGTNVSHAWSLIDKPRSSGAPAPSKGGPIDPGTVLVPAEE